MLKISDEHCEAFKALENSERAIQGVVSKAMHEARQMQAELQQVAKALWDDVLETYGIEGDWRYQDGKLHPVAPPPAGEDTGPTTAV